MTMLNAETQYHFQVARGEITIKDHQIETGWWGGPVYRCKTCPPNSCSVVDAIKKRDISRAWLRNKYSTPDALLNLLGWHITSRNGECTIKSPDGDTFDETTSEVVWDYWDDIDFSISIWDLLNGKRDSDQTRQRDRRAAYDESYDELIADGYTPSQAHVEAILGDGPGDY